MEANNPGRCTCTDKCRLRAAPGEPFALQHDPREHRQAERKALMSRLGKAGGARQASQRQARREGTANELTGRTPAEQLDALDHVIRATARGDMGARTAAAIVSAIRASRAVVMADHLQRENAELKRLLLEKHPELKKLLRKVAS